MRIDKVPHHDVSSYLERKDTILIPIGAVECYGPHLATGTENAICDAWADAVATRADLAVAPIMPFNYSAMFLDYAGTCSIEMTTIEQTLLQLCSGLACQGFRRFLFVNIHAGSIGPIESVCRALRSRFGAYGGLIDIFSVMRDTAEVTYAASKAPTGHGSEMVTSVAMHVCPDLVFADRMQKPGSFTTFSQGVTTLTSGKVKLGASSYMIFSNISDYSPLGIQGDPTGATAGKGRQIWESSVDYGVEAATSFARAVLQSQR
ncbi:creatininase family protein [Gluconacetobacter takamatsuzukensis]|uniref:Creatininase family protein n=1 Tax=Gluconacetobacter takamatsuzukensis TaxID=1286190 RepID=A0A7W4KFU4_9PROT|nr:creatininase family protein [Gluconacetobacter takamatsuzukensis]MBB2206105.1 creatininase family protein [Gluconacetobacter takamatsuzukensis]